MTKEAEDRGDEMILEEGVDEPQGDQAGETADQTEDEAAGEAGDKKDEKAEESEEGSEEGESKAEGEENGEEEEAKPEPKKKILIPKDRFDAGLKKARDAQAAAEKRAQELEASLKQQQGTVDAKKLEAEIDDLDDKIDGAAKDGDASLLKQLRAEQRAKQRQLASAEATAKANYAVAVAVETMLYRSTVDVMEREHPELNPDDESFEQEALDAVAELKEAFEAKGESSSNALKKALNVVYKGAKAPAAEPEKKEPAKKKEAEQKGGDRKAAAVDKGLAAKKQQPSGAASKVGANSDQGGKKGDASHASKLSDKDFDKLTKEEKARARGDFV